MPILFEYKNRKFYFTFLACLLLKIALSYAFSYLATHTGFGRGDVNPFQDKDRKFLFIMVVIIAPPFETLCFQLIPYYALKALKMRSTLLRLVIPSMIFGMLHHYNMLYVLVAFIMGLILNFFFLYCVAYRKNAYVWVVILHSLYNFYTFCFQ